MSSSIRQFWKRLSGTIHPDDASVFEAHQGHGFNLAYPPPAFVGDVDNAPIVVLMSNGGYKPSQTEAEFPDAHSASVFRRWLHGDVTSLPSTLAAYYTSGVFGDWIAAGKAVVVNAVAYRLSLIHI